MAGGNCNDSSMCKSTSLMARNSSMRVLLVIVEANRLDMRVRDIENACI